MKNGHNWMMLNEIKSYNFLQNWDILKKYLSTSIRPIGIVKKPISLDSNGKPILFLTTTIERNMDPSTVLVFLLYGAAIVFIIHFIMTKNTSMPIIIQQESPAPVVYSDSSWWPWSTTSYNYYPYWTGWWSGGSDGGYHRPHHNMRPRFGGGPRGQLGGRYGPIGTPASRPGGGGFGGGRGGGRGGGGRR
jgi:hypothetical protein